MELTQEEKQKLTPLQQAELQEKYELFRETIVNQSIPDLFFDLNDPDNRKKAERISKSGIQDFLSPEDRLSNLVNSKRVVALHELNRMTAPALQAEISAPPPPMSMQDKGFAKSMHSLFNQWTGKTAKKSLEKEVEQQRKTPGPK